LFVSSPRAKERTNGTPTTAADDDARKRRRVSMGQPLGEPWPQGQWVFSIAKNTRWTSELEVLSFGDDETILVIFQRLIAQDAHGNPALCGRDMKYHPADMRAAAVYDLSGIRLGSPNATGSKLGQTESIFGAWYLNHVDWPIGVRCNRRIQLKQMGFSHDLPIGVTNRNTFPQGLTRLLCLNPFLERQTFPPLICQWHNHGSGHCHSYYA
jgi:hypothetical protein